MRGKEGGPCPPGFEDFGPEIWTGNAAAESCGIKRLGIPLGRDEFVAAHADKRIADDISFLEKMAGMKDVQCAWLLPTFCGVPRANHFLRVLPQSVVAPYAKQHDDVIW